MLRKASAFDERTGQVVGGARVPRSGRGGIARRRETSVLLHTDTVGQHRPQRVQGYRVATEHTAQQVTAPVHHALRRVALNRAKGFAHRAHNLILITLAITGEYAPYFWDLHDLHRPQDFDHRDERRVRGWRSIHITDSDQPT